MDGYQRIWQEDDAAPDAERLGAAYARLTGSVKRYAGGSIVFLKAAAVSIDDWGDATCYTLPTGIRIVASYPGNSSMWAPTNYRFVFGSNREGRHGIGAAKTALDFFGAVYGRAEGEQGLSYAVPTRYASQPRGKIDCTVPLGALCDSVRALLRFASAHPELWFDVTRIGCGRAGYRESQIRPLFTGAPANIHLEAHWPRV